ncbi:3-keto-5-aminohexanoate cleavage protein [Microvirga aerophila]|uniref:3-keto-5-aminohexanoate cleavage enzyme n=1 Tax=Microvirga aerophila TaxID=670291 RepID=A0A512BTV0_9HYPH|nr:3-keto-5-aminohexanoate cleavage protein [Microvirga aerophila]GEO15227.1 3-keto-5-aminohexanoate cleavage enzyme [Microvirga aerophila]
MHERSQSTSELSPVSIAVAPNGGRRTKADHPAVPMTPEELARTAVECLDAGACMIHVHVRNAEGRHLLDVDAYAQATAAIREAVGERLVIQITSEALGIYKPEEQMAVTRAVRPEAVSLALRELAPDEASEQAFAEFLTWLHRERVAPQIILYSPEEAIRLTDFQKRGMIPFENLPVLYVLGRYTVSQTSRPADLLPFIAPEMPVFLDWMTCAFGRYETACVTAAALLGGNVRVGFENNVDLPNGERAGSNAELVGQTAKALKACGVALADAAFLRSAWSR